MEAMTLYVVYVLIVLGWCALQARRIRYVKVSRELLCKWKLCRPNVITINLQAGGLEAGRLACDSEDLVVTREGLAGLLRWIPPRSIVVFCCGGELCELDAQIQDILCCAEIETVYFLGRTSSTREREVWMPQRQAKISK